MGAFADEQVKIEEDENYIAFFQDRYIQGKHPTDGRIRVEEEYIAGLKRLYSRSKAVDSLHDEYVSASSFVSTSIGAVWWERWSRMAGRCED